MVKKVQNLWQRLFLMALFFTVTLSYGQVPNAATATAGTAEIPNGFTANWNAEANATGYYLDVSESATFGSGTFASNLIISEYGEGSGGNKKYVEIFNGTGAAVDLANYKIWRISNGGSWPEAEVSLSGTLADGATYVIANNNTDVFNADMTSTTINHNGDDAVGLAWNGGSGATYNLIDAVGNGVDPGTAWSVAGVSGATKDKILIRKSSVLNPNTDWDDSRGTNVDNSEWIVSSFTYNSTAQTTDLGSHTFDGGFTPSFVAGYDGLDVGNVTSYMVTGLEPGTTYYYRVRAYNTSGAADNSNTIQVTTSVCGVVALPTADPQSLCADDATVANLTITTGAMPQWYAAETGGTALATDTAVTTGVYYVSQTVDGCESERAAVAVVIKPTPAMPTVTNLEICGAATVADLTVTAGDMPQWYTAETGGTALATDTAVTTGTYYVSQTVDDCESERAMVEVTIKAIPVAPTADAQAFCGATTVADLMVTAGNMPQWYAAETGGMALVTGAAVTTGVYYASQTVDGCESERTAVAITVNDIPEVPTADAQAFCGAATVADLMVTAGDMPQWYAAETGGMPLATDTDLTTTMYYVSQTVNGCESERAMVNVTVNPIPDAPTVDANVQEFCNVATLADIATNGENILWYETLTDGTALANDMALTEGTTIYYASQTVDGCESTARTAVAVVLTITVAPIVTDLTYCGATTVADLMVTEEEAIQWYNVATGGTALATDAAVTTGIYYASQTMDGCESERAMVSVTVNDIPVAPTADAQTFCGAATVADLMAAGDMPMWYDMPTGGTALAMTDALTTGMYYVSQTVNGCESERTMVNVTVNPIPVAPTADAQTFCGAATVADLMVAGDMPMWYDMETGGTALAMTDALTTGMYYVSQIVNDCESERTMVNVTVNDIPMMPTADAQTFCGMATVADLMVTSGDMPMWYATETGGDALTMTDALTTGTYYVSQTINGCESPRAMIDVTVNAIPEAPMAEEVQVFCNAATVAEIIIMGENLVWYASAAGDTTVSIDTPLSEGTTIYYASQTINGCESARTAVAAVLTVNDVPTVDAQTFCGFTTVADLIAEGTIMPQWYDAVAGGVPLTPETILTTGTYYVSQMINECESLRAAVEVTVNVTPMPVGDATQEFNAGDTIADLDVTGDNLVWYADEALTMIIDTTTELVDGATYYAVANNGDCPSVALAVTADEVLSTPTLTKANFTHYPNPVNDVLNLEFSENITTVIVYNLLGQPVLERNTNGTTVQVDMTSLLAGTYIVRAASANKTTSFKVLKN
ncbi:Ig-like domain-containing protein [Flavobacterium litorale]|uniref:Lamin tail domain-containing protein n=1 Tax=Flavobacterium litorale TaxID=2856519 RepID=A0ABX8V6H8_9FLAO|nr:lamin tail domain-containing protein [Flavobacterium litorale]QYJ68420.1 lamin tail domain-containing protein [Flavobacterium litorale]